MQISRRARLVLALIAGISLSVLATGFFLSRRRRRYRAIPATSQDMAVRSKTGTSGRGALSRSSTFRDGTEETSERRQLRANGDEMTRKPTTVMFVDLG